MFKTLATSLTTFAFLVMGITGVLMYFHLFDNYTKNLHEILGLAFVAIVFFHVFFNWKSMKKYFTKKIFYFSAGLIFIVSLGFILNAPSGPDIKRIMFNSIFSKPIEKTSLLFVDSFDLAKKKLEKEGFHIEKGKSIRELAMINQTSPFKFIEILVNK